MPVSRLHTPIRLGLDFDNTIVLYDHVFQAVGAAQGWLPADFTGDKRAVRDRVRALPDGQSKWTALQAKVYGPGVAAASPSPGLLEFLRWLRDAGIETVVISHKTEFAAADPDGTNLRIAARRWIEQHRLTDPAGGGIAPGHVFFEATRAEKIARIKAEACTHFVDDLDEVFQDPAFPPNIRRYLYDAGGGHATPGPWLRVQHWREVADDLRGRLAV